MKLTSPLELLEQLILALEIDQIWSTINLYLTLATIPTISVLLVTIELKKGVTALVDS